MGDKTKIEWTDATWNPIRGCTVVSEGCRNCYAMNVAARFSGEGQAYEGLAYRNSSGAHWTGKVRLVEEHLKDPLRWKRPRRIFVNSMSDLFHESIADEWIERIFQVMYDAKHHVFQVLTKRPERMLDWISRSAFLTNAPLINVWLGVSVEDQGTANERIPLLLETPAALRWLSAEPLLGPIDLTRLKWRGHTSWDALSGISYDETGDHLSTPFLDWIVVGGESGSNARPMHPDWVRSLRNQCIEGRGFKDEPGLPWFFFKQWGEWSPRATANFTPMTLVCEATGQHWQLGEEPFTAEHQSCPATHFSMTRVGKKTAGHLLDGREWHEFPEARAA